LLQKSGVYLTPGVYYRGFTACSYTIYAHNVLTSPAPVRSSVVTQCFIQYWTSSLAACSKMDRSGTGQHSRHVDLLDHRAVSVCFGTSFLQRHIDYWVAAWSSRSK